MTNPTLLDQPAAAWISREGAEKIMREAGITLDPHAYFGNCMIAARDRETYTVRLLFELAYAIAERAANPADMVSRGTEVEPEVPEFETASHKWAKRSGRQLEKLLLATEN